MVSKKSTLFGDWRSSILLPIKGISDELFNWGHANSEKTAEFITCWGTRWAFIKSLDSNRVQTPHILLLLRKYSQEFDTFLESAKRHPPIQDKTIPFSWGHLSSSCILFERVMISNALINILLSQSEWKQVQTLCESSIEHLMNWQNRKLQDATLSTQYYNAIHSYCGLQMCLPKLNQELEAYPDMKYKHACRISILALQFMKKSQDIYSISPCDT